MNGIYLFGMFRDKRRKFFGAQSILGGINSDSVDAHVV